MVTPSTSSIMQSTDGGSEVKRGPDQPSIVVLGEGAGRKTNGVLAQKPHPVRTSSDDFAKMKTLTDLRSNYQGGPSRQQRPSEARSASASPDLSNSTSLPLPSAGKINSALADKAGRSKGPGAGGSQVLSSSPIAGPIRDLPAQSSGHQMAKAAQAQGNVSDYPDHYRALQPGRNRSASGSQTSKTGHLPSLQTRQQGPRDRSASAASASPSQKMNGSSSGLSHVQDSSTGSSSLPVMPGGFDDRRPSPTSQEGSQSSTSPHPQARSIEDGMAGGSSGSSSKANRGNLPRLASKSAANACAHCHEPIQGQFVRAMDRTFHLHCFTCRDCDSVVAAKFFPVNEDDSEGASPYQLCETCYFRRLSLLCQNCGLALRGSYIEAAGYKYHVNHFTCSECSTIFGAQDSYYEAPNGKILCFLHYSQNYATRCQGCQQAILQQFVEIERDSAKIAFHPCCYMIHKFWNVRWAEMPALVPPAGSTPVTHRHSNSKSDREDGLNQVQEEVERSTIIARSQPTHQINDPLETAETLRKKQKDTDDKVYRIWTILSAYEESSAACISEMLMRISEGAYMESVMMAEKFILHVEILFSAMDDLENMFRIVNAKGTSHAREARLLCKKIVNFFSHLANSQKNSAKERSTSLMQDLLSLVTGLAHYLKILIRIALTGALKLDREHGQYSAIDRFLSKLVILTKSAASGSNLGSPTKSMSSSSNSLSANYKSSVEGSEVTLDQCQACRGTVEDECFRFGRQARWHTKCLRCRNCHREATKSTLQIFTARELKTRDRGRGEKRVAEFEVFCASCAQEGCRIGFDAVTRLEQYSFLLRCALNRLYSQLQLQGLIRSDSSTTHSLQTGSNSSQGPLTPDQSAQRRSVYEAFNSTDIRRMKSVDLDRKLSMSGRVATQSNVVENTADLNDGLLSRTNNNKLGLEGATGSRPNALRSLSSIRVLSDGQLQPLTDSRTARKPTTEASAPSSAFEDSNNLTLGDIPQLAVASQSSGTRPPSLLQSHRQHISELTPLELFAVKHVVVLMIEPIIKDYFSTEELLDLIEVRKTTFWDKIFKGVNKEEKKPAKKKGNFGISLEQLVERNGVDSLLGTGPTRLRIPSFVDDVIAAMKQMDLSIEGIFRKNGNIRRLKELCDAIDRDPTSINLNEENAVQLAALLKKFLRDLPDPLMTFKLHRLWLVSQRVPNESDQLKILHYATILLPKAHRDTMEVVFAFLRWVAQFAHVDEETGSKMDLHNLATVIAPNILIARNSHDPSKEESFAAIGAVQTVLKYQDDFNLVPDQCLGILSDPELLLKGDEITPKELVRRCELFARRQAGGPTLSWGLEDTNDAREVSSPGGRSSFPRTLSPNRMDSRSPLPRGDNNGSYLGPGQSTTSMGPSGPTQYPARDYRYHSDSIGSKSASPTSSPSRALFQSLSPTRGQ